MLEKGPDMIQYVFIFVAFRIICNLIYVFSLIYFFCYENNSLSILKIFN